MWAVIALSGSLTGLASETPEGAQPKIDALTGEAVGVGPVTLADLRGRPTSVVLIDRAHADEVTPVGYALNSTMVEVGGNRVSAVDRV